MTKEPQAHRLTVPRTAHYYTLGQAEQALDFCFVCHGYGQQAGHFIYKWEAFQDRAYIVAPEGLSRFYLDEDYQRIGASWMTRLDREDEIQDYCQWLGALFAQERAKLPAQAKVHLLGFSQGALALSRWIVRQQPVFDQLVLWGAGFPLDEPYQDLPQGYWDNKNVWLVHGDQDPFFKPELVASHRSESHRLPPFKTRVFEGGHYIDRQVLAEVLFG